MGQKKEGSNRNIVAKFAMFKERELVRRQSGTLKGSGHFVFEQFPKEISQKRKKLVPFMKEKQKKSNRSWIAYDTLYVNGVPKRDVETTQGFDGDELKVLAWNINGFTNDKKHSEDFVNNITLNDIVFLFESWTSKYSNVEISGYS